MYDASVGCAYFVGQINGSLSKFKQKGDMDMLLWSSPCMPGWGSFQSAGAKS